jgi:hypothetical protein
MRTCLILTVILLLLTTPGCERNPLFLRLSSDYFPVTSIGSIWEYQVEGGGSQIVTVIDQTVAGERTCYRVQSGADYDYWINESGRLEHFEDHRVIFNGYEIPLFQSWVATLERPLAVGSSRTDSVSSQTVTQGVTILHQWRRITTTESICSTPDGAFDDCYLIHQNERTINWIQTSGFFPETTQVSRNIWLAPDVGMVRKQTADSLLVLTDYQPGG